MTNVKSPQADVAGAGVVDYIKGKIIQAMSEIRRRYHENADEYIRESFNQAWIALERALRVNHAVARGVLESGVEVTPGLRSRLEEVAARAESVYREVYGKPLEPAGDYDKVKQSVANTIRKLHAMRQRGITKRKLSFYNINEPDIY